MAADGPPSPRSSSAPWRACWPRGGVLPALGARRWPGARCVGRRRSVRATVLRAALGHAARRRRHETSALDVVIVGGGRRGPVGGVAARARRRAGLRAAASWRTRRAATRAPGGTTVTALSVGRALPAAAGARGARRCGRCCARWASIERLRPRRPAASTTSAISATRRRSACSFTGAGTRAVPRAGRHAEDRAQLEAFRREMDALPSLARRSGATRVRHVRARAGAPGAFAELDRDLDGRIPDCARLHLAARCAGGSSYACRDDFGTDLAGTSAWAGVHYYAARDPDPRVRRRGADVAGGQRLADAPAGRAVAEPASELGQLVINVEPAGDGAAVETVDAREGRTRRLIAARWCWRVRSSSPRASMRAVARAPARIRGAPSATRPGWWRTCISTARQSSRPARRWPGTTCSTTAPGSGYVVATHQSLRTHTGAHGADLLPCRFPGRAPTEAPPGWSWTHRGRPCASGVLRDLARAAPGPRRRTCAGWTSCDRATPWCGPRSASCGVRRSAPRRARWPDPCTSRTPTCPGFSIFEEAFEWGSRAAARIARPAATILLTRPPTTP